MKFTVPRNDMLEALQILGSVIPSKSVRPIACNMHMVVNSDGMATLSGTDFEIAMSFNLAVSSVDEPGEAVVHAARATSILREAPEGNVEFETNESGKLSVRAGRSSFNLLTEKPEEFPEPPSYDATHEFALNQKQLVSLIRKVLFAVARDKTRFAFNGARLSIEGGEATMVATDGKRLALMTETIANVDGVTASAIIPGRALGVFEKVLSDDEEVRLVVGERDVTMKTSRAVMSARLVEGVFPDHNAVIPKASAQSATFDRVDLQKAFRQAALLTSKETRSVHMTIDSQSATLRSKALDAGDAEVVVDCTGFDGEAITVSYNPDFIAEGLGVLEVDAVSFGVNQANEPARIEAAEEPGFLYVVMPVTQRNI